MIKQPTRQPEPEAAYRAKVPSIRAWLIEVARARSRVTYGEVMMVFDIGHRSLQHAMSRVGRQAADSGEPILTALIVSKTTLTCSDGLAREFGVVDDEAERQALYAFWMASDHDTAANVEASQSEDIEVRAAKFASIAARPDQAAFRRRVFLHCNGRCVVSGCEISYALDAAHRHGRSWQLGHNAAEDGYLLRKDLHALYDRQLLTIDENGSVRLDPTAVVHYQLLEGVRIESGQPFVPIVVSTPKR